MLTVKRKLRKQCPLCSSSKTQTVLEKEVWDIVSCSTCTNAWSEPFPTPVDYSNADFHAEKIAPDVEVKIRNVYDLPEELKNATLMQVDLLKRYLNPGAKILEVGCGEGLLLNELGQSGFTVKGIDPSIAGSQRARTKRLDVITGYFPTPLISESFDMVILSHVLEHFEKPNEILTEVVKVLSADGYLLLVQTNYKGLVPRFMPENWYAWAPDEHYWHFTPKGLTSITQKLFKPITCEFSSLVHYGRSRKVLASLSKVTPHSQDQFHLLLRR